MTVREAIQAKYNRGELSFKELNNLYKEHSDYLDCDYEYYSTLREIFYGNSKMSELIKAIKDGMYIKVSNPIDPKYKEKTYNDHTIDDPTLHPIYNPKYKSVIITRRKLP